MEKDMIDCPELFLLWNHGKNLGQFETKIKLNSRNFIKQKKTCSKEHFLSVLFKETHLSDTKVHHRFSIRTIHLKIFNWDYKTISSLVCNQDNNFVGSSFMQNIIL